MSPASEPGRKLKRKLESMRGLNALASPETLLRSRWSAIAFVGLSDVAYGNLPRGMAASSVFACPFAMV